MSNQYSPADQAVKLYKDYVKLLQGKHNDLLASVQNFVGNARRKVEAMDQAADQQKLSLLDKNLDEM